VLLAVGVLAGTAAYLLAVARLYEPSLLALILGGIQIFRGTRPNRRSGGAVRLDRTGFELPAGRRGRRRIRVPYASVESILDNVSATDDGVEARMVIGTRWRVFVLDQGDFADPDALRDILLTIRAGIAALPNAAERLGAIGRRRGHAWRVIAARSRATYALLLTLAACFGLQLLLRADSDHLAMLRMGANAPFLVTEGQLWRIVSANFLHGGLIHIAANSFALWQLGRLLEKLVGTGRFLAIYAVGGIAGAAASALAANAAMSVGASTAVFGLLGAFAVVHWRYGLELPAGIRQSGRWWLVILLANGAISLIPFVDATGHAGGFVGGALVCWVTLRTEPGAPGGRVGSVLAALSVVVLAVGLGRAAIAYFEPETDDGARFVARFVEASEETEGKFVAEQLNLFAWTIATAREASPAELEAAERAARLGIEKATAHNSDTPWLKTAVRDTLATVLHRQGRREAAVLEQTAALSDALARNASEVELIDYTTQLARFVAAGPRPMIRGGAPRVSLLSTEQGLFVFPERATAEPTHVLVLTGPIDGPSRITLLRLPPGGPWRLEPIGGEALEPVLVWTGEADSMQTGSARSWKPNPEMWKHPGPRAE